MGVPVSSKHIWVVSQEMVNLIHPGRSVLFGLRLCWGLTWPVLCRWPLFHLFRTIMVQPPRSWRFSKRLHMFRMSNYLMRDVNNGKITRCYRLRVNFKKSAFSSTQTMEGIEIFLILIYCLGSKKLKYLQIYLDDAHTSTLKKVYFRKGSIVKDRMHSF
jgi:hypothetical protein